MNSGFITCRAPPSDVVQKAIPFSVSLNKQQNSRAKVDYWYYSQAQVDELVPNYGPDNGGNIIKLKGSNFNPFREETINNANDTFCYFEGLAKMPLKVESSTIAFCEAPPNIANLEVTYLDVALNNQDITDDHVPYFYYKPPKIFDAQPREGPTRGGTITMMYGSDFKADKKILCVYGDLRTHGKFISTAQVKC